MVSAQFEEFEPERLVKSSQRVRDLAEVFTPANIVDEMLDLLPDQTWTVHPSKTFLEPAVGNGNFVSAVLSRKLTLVDVAFKGQSLAAGRDRAAAEFHALQALSSIYGVDISEDNIIGGTPGHEVACRPRLLGILKRWHNHLFGEELSLDADFLKSAQWIVDHNMIIGNMLDKDGNGKPTGREEMPLFEYFWVPEDRSLQVSRTTFGDVFLAAEEEQGDVLSLFGAAVPVKIWEGAYAQLFTAERNARVSLNGALTSNSKGKK